MRDGAADVAGTQNQDLGGHPPTPPEGRKPSLVSRRRRCGGRQELPPASNQEWRQQKTCRKVSTTAAPEKASDKHVGAAQGRGLRSIQASNR